jgi:hypothetical protein
MDFWNRQFSPSEFSDFPQFFRDSIVTTDNDATPPDNDDLSLSSSDSFSTNLQRDPILRHISATTRLDFDFDTSASNSNTTYELIPSGELVDSGGNFCMCNNLDMLVNIHPIKPFGISMAATQDKTAPTCTHRGEFPIPMLDDSVFYTPMFFNPTASDCILSPQAICSNSNGYLVKWIQEGGITSPTGTIIFQNKNGQAVIQLDLHQRNGLYYTRTETLAADVVSDDEANFTQEEALLGLGHPGTATANLTANTPMKDPKRLQLEADLWQARLGHCGDWQLKMIPQAVNGTSTHFNPHPT